MPDMTHEEITIKAEGEPARYSGQRAKVLETKMVGDTVLYYVQVLGSGDLLMLKETDVSRQNQFPISSVVQVKVDELNSSYSYFGVVSTVPITIGGLNFYGVRASDGAQRIASAYDMTKMD